MTRFAPAGLLLAFAVACGGKGGGGGGGGPDGGDGGLPCLCLPDGGYPDGGSPDGGPCLCTSPGGGDDGGSPDGGSGLHIATAQVVEARHDLVLVGEFGDPATPPNDRIVTVATVDYGPPRAEWRSANNILVHMFPSNGPGSAGDIQVKNGTLGSNILQLTEWRGNFRVTRFGTEIPGSTAAIIFDFVVHLRASINGAPGIQLGNIAVDDTTCTFDAVGSYTTLDGRSHVTWSRHGDPNIPWDPSLQSMPGSMVVEPTIDINRRALQVFFAAYVVDGLSVAVEDLMTHQTTTHTEFISYHDGVRDFGIQFQPDWVIPPGSYTQPVSATYKIEWGSIVPNYPPR